MKKSILALAAAALAAPSAAAAYERTEIPGARNSCLYWESRGISWSPAARLGGNLPAEEALDAIRLSFDEWESQGCSDLVFVEKGAAGRDVGYTQRGSNSNVVLFRDAPCDEVVPSRDPCLGDGSCADEYDCWDYESRLIAVTTTTFSQCTGEIVDADVEFNAAAFEFTTGDGAACGDRVVSGCVATDVRNTLVHEIGHMIGLDHSRDGTATMYASAPHGETQKRSLAADDVEALCDIYPAGEATWICEPARPAEACSSGSDSSGSTGSGLGCAAGGGGLAALGLLPALAWARRRRSR
ncbi:myxosortase-dependent metalloprotease, MXAN_2677/MXAN_2678 family [Vulgatibacter sp.]|uniref:myxosortase-dependent metalloprotease, MXAN_2677/MXAN_2678 family n=1 Tax=Vulgatibacter sp. TaxID=1971226 RepID=UPI003565AAA7